MKIIIGLLMAATGVTLHGARIELPDVLTMQSGQKVTTSQQWTTQRRPQVLELFRKHIYGRATVGRPETLKFEPSLTPNMMNGAATRKLVNISYEGRGGKGTIRLILFVPTAATKPVPCFLLINNRSMDNIDPTREKKSPFWPAEQIVARGYAAAVFWNGDVAPDKKDSYKEGVHGIFDRPGERAADAWGTIAAWSWGASRALDYLQTDSDIDGARVAVVGHSRGGKATLWAGAQDERFGMVVSNNSGSTGAAIARGKQGETIKVINQNFPHWFNQNYKAYADRENELPVDQHMLAGLIAPRPLYISSASEDLWADPQAEFLSGVEATPVYRLFGLEGLKAEAFPKSGAPLHEGKIGYHLRTGTHSLTEYDWQQFMNFADKHLAKPKIP
jgi:pimeloyl-ACP methyl ester carboxylesterase